MKGILALLVFLGIPAVIFGIIFAADEWVNSNNKIKQNIGHLIMIIICVIGLILGILYSINSCKNEPDSTYDYYDSPRK